MASVLLRTTIPTDEGGSRFVTEPVALSEDTKYGLKSADRPIDGFYVRRVNAPESNDKLRDYHRAPQDQYVIQLKGGTIEVGSTEGQKVKIRPVSVARVMDVTGRGHSSVPLTNDERISLFIPIPEGSPGVAGQ